MKGCSVVLVYDVDVTTSLDQELEAFGRPEVETKIISDIYFSVLHRSVANSSSKLVFSSFFSFFVLNEHRCCASPIPMVY